MEQADGCWLWSGAVGPKGYGVIRSGPARQDPMVYVHRLAYETWVGPVLDGFQIDHTCHGRALEAGTCQPGPCDHRRCVNPAHLEAVSVTENLMRGRTITARNAARTQCPHGHPYADENLIVEKSGFRKCRTCVTARLRRRQSHSLPDGGQ